MGLKSSLVNWELKVPETQNLATSEVVLFGVNITLLFNKQHLPGQNPRVWNKERVSGGAQSKDQAGGGGIPAKEE